MEILLKKPSNYNSSITHTVNVGLLIQYAIVTAVWALLSGVHSYTQTYCVIESIPPLHFSHHAIVCIFTRDKSSLVQVLMEKPKGSKNILKN